MCINIYDMIIYVWKPKVKNTKGLRETLYYTKCEINDIFGKNSQRMKVLYKCDCDTCKTPNKLHSITREHLNKNRSKTVNEDIQICRSCQVIGSKNPRFGDNRKLEDLVGLERAKELKLKMSQKSSGENNPSKRDDVKNKKNQFIVNFQNVSDYMKQFNFILNSIDGSNKFARIKFTCCNNHKTEINWCNFKVKRICRFCYYESIRIPLEQINDFEKYNKKVRLLSRFNFNKNISYIKDGYLKIKDSKNYHIDHIYSIADGFKNGVNPEIVASHHNLSVISKEENLKKGKKSDITLNCLLEKLSHPL